MEVIDGFSEDDTQTSSASPDSPAVKVLMQAWKEVPATQRKMLDAHQPRRSARTGERARRADVSHLKSGIAARRIKFAG